MSDLDNTDVDDVASADRCDLPAYNGQPATTMESTIKGTKNQVNRPHHAGDRIVAVVELEVSNTGHRSEKRSAVYLETLEMVDFHELDGDPARRLISALRQERSRRENAHLGHEPLEGMEVVTDASGVVLTDAELAELRDNPVVALGLPDDQVVVVYDNGERLLWPDEFPDGCSQPIVGEGPHDWDDDITDIDMPLVQALLDDDGDLIAGEL